MRVVIAHRSPVQKARLIARIGAIAGIEIVRVVSELHETYDFAEHHNPDCVVISSDLADRPEFELLGALLRIMGIGCIVLEETEHSIGHHIPARTGSHIIRLAAHSDHDVLAKAIRRAEQTPARFSTRWQNPAQRHAFHPQRIILIGSSTGGVDALLRILSEFPADCPPTMIVQHTGGHYARSLIRLLDGATAARVLPAREGMELSQGEIYLAPDDTAHLTLRAGGLRQMSLRKEAAVCGHRPSVDALFCSALDHAQQVTAALLTGMGRDGAEGITKLRHAGARTIGQDAATCVVHGMPRIAKEMGGIETELPLPLIGQAILETSDQKVAS